jgi:LmbE family N-acetylglucosaminyl deacetylase
MGAVAPERLFYGTMLRDVFRGLADKTRGRGITDGLDPDVFGTAAEMIAVSFDASSFVQQKFLALAAHRSAFGVTEEMLSSPPAGAREMLDAFRPVFAREVFVLGGTRIPTPRWPLNDFFDGVAAE